MKLLLAHYQQKKLSFRLFLPARCDELRRLPLYLIRALKILYLQNNIIAKMENLFHMKDLQYFEIRKDTTAEARLKNIVVSSNEVKLSVFLCLCTMASANEWSKRLFEMVETAC
jgi:hypothetical protein